MLSARDSAPSGIAGFSSLPWGSHFAHIYRSGGDLRDILVPYFRAGLENDEQCLWVTDSPFEASDARAALRAVLPDLDAREARGQIDIQDIRAFYDPAEPLQPRPLVAGLLLRERQALARGYRGLRTNGNCGWVGERQWTGFCEYEGLVQEAVQGRRLICTCSYCPDHFRGGQISDVIERHDLVLRNRSGTGRRRDEGARRFAGAANSKPGAALIGHNASAFQDDLDAIDAISAVPTILEVACRTAGLGFGAVARVTADHWVCLAVRDEIGFGLRPGGELKVETTLCHEVRQAHDAVVIDHVANDTTYAPHPSPAMYGFQSYISMPIFRRDGRFFGTLCGFDPRPAKLYNSTVIGMFRMFADLIAFHLAARTSLAT